MHFCVVTQAGGLYHTIHFADGSWANQWGDVRAAALLKIDGVCGTVACAADQGGNLGVCVLIRSDQRSAGNLWFAQRNNDGSWAGFSNVDMSANFIGSMLSLGVSFDLPPS